MKILRRIFVVALVFAVCGTTAASACSTYGYVEVSKDKKVYSKVEGYGKANIVFLSGYGDGITTYTEQGEVEVWSQVTAGLPADTKKFTYDQLGIGQSDDIENRFPLTQEQMDAYFNFETVNYDFDSLYSGKQDLIGKTSVDRADQLYLTLKNSKDINGPVIIVAHSIGMFTAYEFALKYPDMVKGIVSVDGTFPTSLKEITRFLENNLPDIKPLYLGQFTNAAGNLNEMILSSMKIEQSQEVVNGVPLIIVHDISGENGPELQALSDSGVEFWLNKFPSEYSKSENVNSGHYVMLNKPDAVISAINEMIKLVYPEY